MKLWTLTLSPHQSTIEWQELALEAGLHDLNQADLNRNLNHGFYNVNHDLFVLN